MPVAAPAEPTHAALIILLECLVLNPVLAFPVAGLRVPRLSLLCYAFPWALVESRKVRIVQNSYWHIFNNNLCSLICL